MRTKELFKFIEERHAIFERKVRGLPKPWTKDKILQDYRFCNVYRELDTQTIWFAEHWRRKDPDLWFASLVFRCVNWSETTEEIGYPVPFSRGRFERVLYTRGTAGKKVYNGAYMISTHGAKEAKYKYLGNSLHKIWTERETIRYRKGEHLSVFHERLMSCFDVGSFLAAQVVADCKYIGDMKKAPDWYTFAASGPGSRRGLNRIYGRDVKSVWHEDMWRFKLTQLHKAVEPLAEKAGMRPLDAQDLQNCLCEFDKYERVRLGEGRPKMRYNGRA
jgi:hypothetical protein